MKIEKVLADGKILNAEDVNLDIAGGVFETFRVNRGKIFLLDEHFARLQKSLKALNINPIDENKISDDIRRISDLAPEDAFVRLVVSPTQIALYMASIPKLSAKPVDAKILNSATHKIPKHFHQIGFRLKSTDYLDFLAENELPEGQAGIMLDENGYVAEALTANVFWVKSGNLYTSPLSLGILAGTMRDYVIRTNEVTQKLIKGPDLIEADEIFLTNSVNYIMPVGSINGIKKPGINGPAFQNLDIFDLYLESIGFC